MKSHALVTGVLFMAMLAAQEPKPPVVGTPIQVSPYTQLKAYLNLTDAQLQSLLDIQKSRAQAEQAIYKQIADKQTQVNQLLNSGSGNATQIGQLMLDIQALRKQLPVSAAPYRQSALDVLTADQKAKLPALSAALQLQAPAYQAINLNLMDPLSPTPGPLPRIPAMAGEFGFETPPASEVQ